MKGSRLYIIALAFVAVFLSACGQKNTPNEPRPKVKLDAELSALYESSCANCHTVAATGAPLTGDVARWEELMDKGMDVLMVNVINGFKGMPPAGQCFECSPEQMEQLVLFMSQPEN